MINGEAANTNFIVYGLTRWALKLMIYRIRGNPANRYTTNTVTSAYIYESERSSDYIRNTRNIIFPYGSTNS